jgi:toxin ParE1/3/4
LKKSEAKFGPGVAYRLSLAARQDLRTIYTDSESAFGEIQAGRYITGLRRTLAFLADNPRAARERAEFEPPVRVHRYGSHVVVYVLDAEDVLVVRIRHGREDWAGTPSGN